MILIYHLWLQLLVLVPKAVNVLGETNPVSGNAMDLANMNMHLMQTGCPLLPCQSACVKKNVQTGCYECACGGGSGNGVVNPSMNNPMLPIGNGQMYRCNPSWMACSSQCTKVTDPLGCFRCKCRPSPSLIKASVPPGPSTSIHGTHLQSSPSHPSSTKQHTTTPVLQQNNKTITTHPVTSSPSYNSKHTTNRTTAGSLLSSDIPLTKYDTSTTTARTVTETNNEEQRSSQTYFDSNVSLQQRQSKVFNKIDKRDNLKYIITIFSIGTVLVVSLTSSVVFLLLWRRSARQLRQNKDELYFVNKANRQDSQARLSRNDLMDPVYTDVHQTPTPPPRTPPVSPLTPTAPITGGFLRSSSCSSETPLKQKMVERASVCHDYLELI